MKVRIISATVGILVLAGILTLSMFYPFVWNIAVAILTAIAVHEVIDSTKCCRSRKIRNVSIIFAVVVGLLPLLPDGSYYIASAAMLYTLALFIICMRSHGKVTVKHISVTFMMTIIITLTFMCIAVAKDILGMKSVLLMIGTAWISDTFALFSGMLFGKHKLAPEISPKKTVEGAIGGFVLCIVICVSGCWLYTTKIASPAIEINLVNLAIVVAACSVVSMIGDLIFSAVKRYYKIKDYGKIMPGHGGVLDRFDSVLFAAPVFIILSHYLPFIYV